MDTILVTGATGILGSNVCTMLLAQGRKARAVARDMNVADVRSLQEVGVEVVPGDLKDLESLERACAGVDGVIHSGAMLGRPGATWEEAWASNVLGTVNVLTAAARSGDIPVVQVLTTTFFDRAGKPLTERTPIDLRYTHTDMYSTTKRLAYAEGLARAADGQDIRFMIPAAIYGPTVCVEKGMMASTFNDRIRRAIRGEMPPLLPLKGNWVTGEDCAYVCIAALDKGERGERYIGHGAPEDGDSMAAILNRACAMAGSPHRVEEIPPHKLDSPEVFAQFGPTMPLLAKLPTQLPAIDSSYTENKLGYVPTRLADGFADTLAWMREINVL